MFTNFVLFLIIDEWLKITKSYLSLFLISLGREVILYGYDQIQWYSNQNAKEIWWFTCFHLGMCDFPLCLVWPVRHLHYSMISLSCFCLQTTYAWLVYSLILCSFDVTSYLLHSLTNISSLKMNCKVSVAVLTMPQLLKVSIWKPYGG